MKKIVTILVGAFTGMQGILQPSKDVVEISGNPMHFKEGQFRDATFDEACKFYLSGKEFVKTELDDNMMTTTFTDDYRLIAVAGPKKNFCLLSYKGNLIATN